MQKGDVTNEAK